MTFLTQNFLVPKLIISRDIRPISNHLNGLCFAPNKVQKPSNICKQQILGLNMTFLWTDVRIQVKVSPI